MDKNVMPVNRHRSTEDIVADILVVAKNRSNKTNIMYKANLSQALLYKYLDKIIDAGLLTCEGRFYVLTPRGIEYLEIHAQSKSSENELMKNELMINEKEMTLNSFLCRRSKPKSRNK